MVRRQLRRSTARQQITQDRVQLVDGADPGRGAVVPVHLTPVPVDMGRGRRGGVDPVVLATAAAGELTDAAGRPDRIVDNGFAAGDQPYVRATRKR